MENNMNLQVADYGTIIKFGTIQDLNTKLQQEGKSLADVKNDIDENGVSLLEKCLAGRKFDIAKLLLQMDAEVNIVSKEDENLIMNDKKLQEKMIPLLNKLKFI